VGYSVFFYPPQSGSEEITRGFGDNTVTITDSNSVFSVNDPLVTTFDAQSAANVSFAGTYTYNGTTYPVISQVSGQNTSYFVLGLNSPSNVSGVFNATSLACYLRGTRLATPVGEAAIEDLAIGDVVLTASGAPRPVKWIGHRTIDCARHPRPWDVNPVRIKAGAFGDDLPKRDLLLSPDHAVHADGVLIPVRHLINDATIVQEQAGEISYWHVELDRHDVILAEGLPAESYLDTGNRSAFANADVPALQPGFAIRDRDAWHALACAPLVEDGEALKAVQLRLAARAAERGAPVPAGFEVAIVTAGRVTAEIPPGTDRIYLASASLQPHGESRRLGAAVAAISLNGVTVPLDAPELSAGFHAVEGSMRWTNGRGLLKVQPHDRSRRLVVDVVLMAAIGLADAA
jgi:hypothetical protein